MSPRIFLVEDAPQLREVFVLTVDLMDDLELVGTAASGEEGIEKIEELNPDVVLVDGSLPGMSGSEFVQKARASKPSMKFIFFSGRDEPETVRAALDAGACGYLVKGGQPDELQRAVHACLDGACYVSPTVRGWEKLAKPAGQTS